MNNQDASSDIKMQEDDDPIRIVVSLDVEAQVRQVFSHPNLGRLSIEIPNEAEGQVPTVFETQVIGRGTIGYISD